MNRRQFLRAAAASTVCLGALGVGPGLPSRIGCFNRPWTKWGFDEALDGVKAAGYPVIGLLTRSKTEPFIGADATPDYLASLKKRIADRGLTANMGAIRTKLDGELDAAIRDLRQQIDNAHALSLQWLMSFGVDKPQDYNRYYALMSDGAAYATERGLKLVLKPHGGSSGAAEEILRSIEKINHPNFSIWYDAGNIIHYTGKDPVAELEPIARHITGFCAKDCARQKGDVMIQLGSGQVDFKGVFTKLKAAGFNGPIMLEGSLPGETPAEATSNARANREFLEKVLASVG